MFSKSYLQKFFFFLINNYKYQSNSRHLLRYVIQWFIVISKFIATKQALSKADTR